MKPRRHLAPLPALLPALCLALAMGSAAHAGPSAKTTSLLSCTLQPGQAITLKARSHGIEGVALLTRWQGDTRPAFDEAAGDELVGQLKLKACVQRTLVYALNYGPPYTKGVALRVNPGTGQTERIDFAEKALPRYLDLGATGMRLVFPNEGGEHDLKYTIYRSGAAESLPADELPPLGGAFKRYRLPR